MRTPTVVPKEVLEVQPNEVQTLLHEWAELHGKPVKTAADRRALKKVRAQLRSKNFRLSKLASPLAQPEESGVPVRTTSVTLSEDLHKRLRIRAIEEGRTASAIIQDALTMYLTGAV